MITRIFVYGTLRQGYWNWDHYLRDRSVFRGQAKTNAKFTMCLGGRIPWIVPNDNGVQITGEVYDISDEQVARDIDRLESSYKRVEGLVTLSSGAVIKAVYYQSQFNDLYGNPVVVESGDYTTAVPIPEPRR